MLSLGLLGIELDKALDIVYGDGYESLSGLLDFLVNVFGMPAMLDDRRERLERHLPHTQNVLVQNRLNIFDYLD